MGFSRSGLATRAARGIGRVALDLSIDVTDAESVEAAVAAHIKHFGGLDVMVASAGIDRGRWRNVVFMIKQAADSDLGECQ